MARVIDKLEKLDEKMDKKFDRVEERLDSMDRTLVKQEANLAEHMRRTELAENAIKALDEDLAPIKKHVNMLQGVLKLIAVLGTVVGIAVGIAKLFFGM